MLVSDKGYVFFMIELMQYFFEKFPRFAAGLMWGAFAFAVLLSPVHANTAPQDSDSENPVLSDFTPDKPFAVWTKINTALLEFAEIHPWYEEYRHEVLSLSPIAFEGKRPEDVFQLVLRVSDELGSGLGENLSKSELDAKVFLDEVFNRLGTDQEVSPLMVYLRSIQVLDSLMYLLIYHEEKQFVYSGFYDLETFHGKTPNDVYGLVDLALRRLLILKNSRRIIPHGEIQ